MTVKSLTVQEVAEYLQLSEKTVRSKISKGEIPRIPDIGEVRVPNSYITACEIGNYEQGTFAERKLKQVIEAKEQEIMDLKNTIRAMVRTGLEVNL